MNTWIVGGGIAGICMHFYLMQRGVEATLVTANLEGSSSIAAAGIINPLTGPAFSRSWRYEELQRVFVPFYKSLGDLLGIEILKPVRFNRYLNPDQVKTWLYKKELPEYAAYCGDLLELTRDRSGRQKQKVEVNNAFRLNMQLLINTYLSVLEKKGLLIKKQFDYHSLKSNLNKLTYKGQLIDNLIFAEGFHIASNPFFSYIPVVPNLGQVILVEDPAFDKDLIIKKKHLKCSWSDNRCWYGATLSKMDGNVINPDNKTQLMDDYFHDFDQIPNEPELISGIRPTMPDRRPVAGTHPDLQGLYCMNGLGSKGSSLGPWVAECLGRNILDQTPLPQEIDIRRFDNKRSI